jgi:hypothetical protein
MRDRNWRAMRHDTRQKPCVCGTLRSWVQCWHEEARRSGDEEEVKAEHGAMQKILNTFA